MTYIRHNRVDSKTVELILRFGSFRLPNIDQSDWFKVIKRRCRLCSPLRSYEIFTTHDEPLRTIPTRPLRILTSQYEPTSQLRASYDPTSHLRSYEPFTSLRARYDPTKLVRSTTSRRPFCENFTKNKRLKKHFSLTFLEIDQNFREPQYTILENAEIRQKKVFCRVSLRYCTGTVPVMSKCKHIV